MRACRNLPGSFRGRRAIHVLLLSFLVIAGPIFLRRANVNGSILKSWKSTRPTAVDPSIYCMKNVDWGGKLVARKVTISLGWSMTLERADVILPAMEATKKVWIICWWIVPKTTYEMPSKTEAANRHQRSYTKGGKLNKERCFQKRVSSMPLQLCSLFQDYWKYCRVQKH